MATAKKFRQLGAKHRLEGLQQDPLLDRAQQDQLAQQVNNALGGMNFGGVQPSPVPSPVPLTARAPASVAANGMNVGPPEDDDRSGFDPSRLIAPLTGTAVSAASPAIARGASELMGSGSDIAGGSMSGGFGLAGAGLGLLGGLTGERGLSQAGSVVGGIPAAALVASAVPALAGSAMGPALAGLSANPYTAAVAAAIIQAMDLYNSLDQDYSAPHTIAKGLVAPIPVVGSLAGEYIDKAFLPSEDWTSFPSDVGKTAGLSSDSLSALAKGLPYVRSKQELAQAIAQFKTEIGTRVGGYGEGSGPYELPQLPGVGPRTHGVKTPEVDFGPAVNEGQRIINALLSGLPDTYTGADAGSMGVRNYLQFRTNAQGAPAHAPQQFFTNNPTELNSYRDYPGQFAQSNRQYIADPSMPATAEGRQVLYGQPGYDYKTAGFPAPGKTLGVPTDYWAQLTGRPKMTEEERRAREGRMFQDAFTGGDTSGDISGDGSFGDPASAGNGGFGTGDGGTVADTSGQIGAGVIPENVSPGGGAGSGGSGDGPGGGDGGGSGGGDGGGGSGGDGGAFRRGGRVRPGEQPTRRQRPDPRRLSEMLKKGGVVNVGDDDDTTDDVPVVLTRGEYVIDKNSTEQFEPLLKKINQWGGRGPTRSSGGMGGFGVTADRTFTGLSTDEPSTDPRPRSLANYRNAGPVPRPQPGESEQAGFQARPSARGGFHVTGRPRDKRR